MRLIADPAMRGVVKKKAGKNAQIDFTDSGGEPNKWTPVENLEHAGAAESAPAEKAAAAAADEAQQAPEPEPEGGPLKPQEVVVGMAVRKCADASATGKILVRRGQRARVDFSSSGSWRATFPLFRALTLLLCGRQAARRPSGSSAKNWKVCASATRRPESEP